MIENAHQHTTLMTFLLIAVVASAIGVIYCKHLNRINYSELQVLNKQQDDMNVKWGQWQLEKSTFATSSEIERSARSKLGMRQPLSKEIKIVRP